MADTDIGTQESGVNDEFAGINPDDVAALISGQVEEINLPNQPQEQTGENGNANGSQQSQPSITMTREELQEILEKSVSAGVANGSKAAQGQQQPQAKSDPNEFFNNYEQSLKESYAKKHGLNEEGAAFMASTTLEAVKPLVQMMAQGFQNLSNRDAELQQGNLLDQVDRNINSWLDDKQISDASLRDDIAKLARYNTAQIDGADMNTLRAEFEKVAGRYLKQQLSEEEGLQGQASQDKKEIPPTVNSGKLGFDDLVRKVSRSQAKEDDIGGERLVGLAERMIRQGMSGGGI